MVFSSRRRVAASVALLIGATLVVAGCSGSSGDPEAVGETLDPDEKVTLNFTYWGNDVRAEMYDEVLAAFAEQYPNITVNTSFMTFAEYWEKRQTEAAGGGLPDVMQFSDRYLRQYAENGLLSDLSPYLGDTIRVDALPDTLLGAGELDGRTLAIPVSTNNWSLWTNPQLLGGIGVDDFEGGDWGDYQDWLVDVSEASQKAGQQLWGANDYTAWMQNFEIQQRAKGEDLFTEGGEPNFTKDDLREFWSSVEDLRGTVLIPQQKLEEVAPMGGFDAALQTAELAWDNLGPGYLSNLGSAYAELGLHEPPVTVEGAKDLYAPAGMMFAASSKTEHPAAAAALIDFLVNDEITGEVFGLNRGVPASETALAGADFEGIEAQIIEHQASLEDRIGAAPPVPIIGYGSLFEKFRALGQELNFGTITVDEAVEQFFAEMDVIVQEG
ncbi:ABC transporter substrate-binding protein [Microbacterium sp.]|uniref:ABC transporter substrate-binding protein n=1 Tax=Microbacterium sp. TaxID=51671 RepID=UPI0028A1D293|nr:ABC transporter substrate-binding protein [Microbacterium sp.]